MGLISIGGMVACTMSLHEVVNEILACLMSEFMFNVLAYKMPEALPPEGRQYIALYHQ